ncbi:hypothetical protein K9U40_03365 [Xanthobacter autotrophicus]|uniref:hypothetical protein n=1 Tax=Xanthobacter TaxID=279 RepID=UPI0024AA6BCB|nr:hypothetical protein [Xanthobacter autotrophicus]MDI4663382.1 hypothetical protein [Xanthobacter autotrophicus]
MIWDCGLDLGCDAALAGQAREQVRILAHSGRELCRVATGIRSGAVREPGKWARAWLLMIGAGAPIEEGMG